MAANEGSSGGQVFKRYQLFDVESFEEKVVKKPKGSDIATEPSSALEPSAKLSSIVSSQGLAIYNDVWYILGAVKQSEAQPNDLQHMLFACSKGITMSAIECHSRSFGLRGVEIGQSFYIVTLGEDLPFDQLQGRKASEHRQIGVLIKIWSVEHLIDCKYVSLSDYKKEDPVNKLQPRIIPLDKNIPFHHICSMAVSKDLTQIAVGLQNGNVILVRTTSPVPDSLAIIADKEIRTITLVPEQGGSSAVTNIHITEFQEKGRQFYLVFCTTETQFYMFQTSQKQNTFVVIANDIGALPGEMDGEEMNITILCSAIGELRKYNGINKENSWPMKEHGVIFFFSKHLLENSKCRKKCNACALY